MSVVSITKVTDRVKFLLLASTTYGGAASSSVLSTFPDDNEFKDAGLEADAVIVRDIIETVGHPYRSQFFSTTGILASGDEISAHVGAIGKVEIDDGTGTYKGGTLAASRAEVLEVVLNPTLYPDSKRWYWIEDVEVVHTGAGAKIRYPNFVPSASVCQSPDAYTDAVIAGAISLLYKDGSAVDFFQHYSQLFNMQREAIRNKELVIPTAQQFQRMAA